MNECGAFILIKEVIMATEKMMEIEVKGNKSFSYLMDGCAHFVMRLSHHNTKKMCGCFIIRSRQNCSVIQFSEFGTFSLKLSNIKFTVYAWTLNENYWTECINVQNFHGYNHFLCLTKTVNTSNNRTNHLLCWEQTVVRDLLLSLNSFRVSRN